MTQVAHESYVEEGYANVSRFSSYYFQIQELLRSKPVSILEVGVGDGVVSGYIRRNTAIAYTTADFAEDTKPDVVADIRKLPFPDASFDTVAAFEVLEHLSFDDFETGCAELARVAQRTVVISVPHFGPAIKFLLKL